MQSKSHIIAVVGGKGGVGKSVVTANLAFATQKELRASTLLIDLDQKSCGDQNIITGLRPLKTVSQLVAHKGVISQSTLSTLLSHHSCGLAYLGAVASSDQTLSGDPQLFSQQLMSLSQHYKYIFVDMGCEVSELQMAVLDHISMLLIVLTPEILVINQTKRILNELSSVALPNSFMQLVINKQAGSGMAASTIQRNLNLPIINTIPADELMTSQSVQSSQPFVLFQSNHAVSRMYYQIIRQLTGGMLQKNQMLSRPKVKTPSQQQTSDVTEDNSIDPLTLLKMQVHTELIQEMDLKKDLTKAKSKKATQEIRTKATSVVSRLVDKRGQNLSRSERATVIKHVLDEALGLGALEELLSDPAVTEIMVNGASQIYCEKNGKLQLSPVTFTSNTHLKIVIERIVTPLGRRIDEKNSLRRCQISRW